MRRAPVLLPHAEEAVVGARHADLVESTLLLHLVRDGHGLHGGRGRHDGHDRALELLRRVQRRLLRVARLGLGAVAREDDQLALELLEPLHVDLQRLGGAVPPAVVHRDANGARLLAVDTSLLELSKREAAALAQLVVVLDRRRVDDRAQQARGRARGDGSGLCLALHTPALLARRLVEPGLDVVLPADLVEVRIGDH
eukprot:5480935-Prymnesium_polylepis.1